MALFSNKSHHTIYPVHNLIPIVDPNNYIMIIMVHPFFKLYVMFLYMNIFSEIDRRFLRARDMWVSKLDI